LVAKQAVFEIRWRSFSSLFSGHAPRVSWPLWPFSLESAVFGEERALLAIMTLEHPLIPRNET